MQEKLKLESIKNINKNIKLVPLLSKGECLKNKSE